MEKVFVRVDREEKVNKYPLERELIEHWDYTVKDKKDFRKVRAVNEYDI